MFAYKIVHLTFCEPQIAVCAHVYANVYLAVHLLQRQKYFTVEGKLKVTTHLQPRIEFVSRLFFIETETDRYLV